MCDPFTTLIVDVYDSELAIERELQTIREFNLPLTWLTVDLYDVGVGMVALDVVGNFAWYCTAWHCAALMP